MSRIISASTGPAAKKRRSLSRMNFPLGWKDVDIDLNDEMTGVEVLMLLVSESEEKI